MFKFLNKMVSFIVIAALTVPMALAESGRAFQDVDEYNSYGTAIQWMHQEGVIEGYGDGNFGPDNCVNRVEFLKMLFEMLEEDVTVYGDVVLFPDTAAGQWYTNYVRAAKGQGIINGYPDGTFKPAQCMNRAEAMKMAILAFNNGVIPEYRTWHSEYDDVKEGQWFYDYVDYALSANIVGSEHLYTEGTGYNYKIAEEMTRAEVAEMLYRIRSLQDYNAERYQWSFKPAVPDDELFFVGCELDGAGMNDFNSEKALPSGVDLVVSIDHTNSYQITRLKEILGLFNGEGNGVDTAKEAYDDGVHKQMSYEKAVKALLAAKWEFTLGLMVDETGNIDSLGNGDVYLTGYFEEEAAAEYLFGRFLQMESDEPVQCEVKGDFVYWTSVNDDFYAAHSGEFFMMANSESAREKILNNVSGGVGFTPLEDGNLARMYLSKDFGAAINNDSTSSLIEFTELFASIGVDSDGFVANSWTSLEAGNEQLAAYAENTLSLINKAVGSGVYAYVEAPSLKQSLQISLSSAYAYLAFSQIMEDVSSEIDLTVEQFETLIDAPVALVISDGGTFPDAGFYLDIDEGNTVLADAILAWMDDKFATRIDEENTNAKLSDATGDILALEKINGTKMRKITFVDNFTDQFWTDFNAEVGEKYASFVDLEFYYGITDDGVLVVAMSPDFLNNYGMNSIANDVKIKEARGMLDNEGSSLFFLDVDGLMKMFRFFSAIEGSPESLVDEVETAIEPIRYFIDSSRVNGNKLYEEGHLKVQ